MSARDWRLVPFEVRRLAVKYAAQFQELQKLYADSPHAIYWDPTANTVHQCPGTTDLPDTSIRVKQAAGFSPVSDVLGSVQKPFGGPNPLTATLLGGVLGGGLGYGAGALMEHLLPERTVERGRLRKTLGLLGAGAGAAVPALGYGLPAYQLKGVDGLTSGWPFRPQDDAPQVMQDSPPAGPAADVGGFSKISQQFLKSAEAFGGAYLPRIPVNQFQEVLFADPETPAPIQAAAAGLVAGASAQSGGVNWVSPAAVARIAMGAGSGALSAMLVGKTLGALAGLTPEAQQSLQQAGIWAGVLSNVVPMAFGH